MSLELELQRCTEALNALTAVLSKTAIFPVVDTAPAVAEVAPPKPQSTTPSPAGLSNVIDYAQVAKAITDTFKVDRAKTIEALAKFGAAKGPQLKPEDYAAFLKVLTA